MICVLLFCEIPLYDIQFMREKPHYQEVLPVSWAWSSISTTIAFHARSKSLSQKQPQLAASWTTQGTPSIVDDFGICFFIGSFFFAFWLGRAPRLTLPLFFGLTLMVLLFSVNPRTVPFCVVLPARDFLTGAAFYSAISTAALLFVFPESYNHTWLPRLRRDVFLPIIEFLEQETQQALKPIFDLDCIINTYELEKGLFETEFSIHRMDPRTLEVCQRRMYEVTSNLTLAENAAEREDAPFKMSTNGSANVLVIPGLIRSPQWIPGRSNIGARG
ncbi:hypothetical protein BJ912DRAFT_998467 [Pholiota molesta]|nr:hypothetical protein BJ912DRAFT_998467 [Pholiota molesta]